MRTKLVIFGITGDLARRRLLPAVHAIAQAGTCDPLEIIGVSRRAVNAQELIQEATGSDLLVSSTQIVQFDVAHLHEYSVLKEKLALADDEQAVIYLSVPPGAAADIADLLGEAGITGPRIKLLFEKPFGYDEASARDFINRTARSFDDEHTYRIDHYMAKEVALGLLELRAEAENHQHHWDNRSVESVEIVATETLDVQGRGHFYEQTGALRDIVQGHLLQLLSLVLMKPVSVEQLSLLPNYRLNALKALKPADPRESVRAQYDGYDTEVDNPGSTTETFVSLVLESEDPRWKDVPIRVLTGKALHEKKTAILVNYKDGTKDTFVEGEVTSSIDGLTDAYERVLVQAIQDQKALFTTAEEIIRSWQVLAPVQHAWDMNDVPLQTYDKGQHASHVHLQRYI